MSVLTILLYTLIVLFVYLIKLKNQRPINFPPGPPRLPLWGSYWYILRANYQLAHIAIEKIAAQYRTNILGFFLGSVPVVVGLDYDTCKEILTRDEFIGRPAEGYMIKVVRGGDKTHGLIFAEGPAWKEQRRFTLRHMRDFGFGRRDVTIEDFTAQQLQHLLDILEKGVTDIEDYDVFDPSRKGLVYMPDAVYGYYLNCIWYILARKPFPQSKLREVARTAFSFQRSTDPLGSALGMTPWLRFFAPKASGWTSAVEDNKDLFDFCMSVVMDHESTLSGDKNRDFIDTYLRQLRQLERDCLTNTSFTMKQLAYALLDGMFPAATGMGHTTNFLFAYLLNNPELQRRIQSECDRVIGRSRLPHIDDRQNMPYTQAVLREILRAQPINPLGIVRRCVEDTKLNGYFIPKNTLLYTNVWTAHRDPEQYPDPHCFRPERWLDSNGHLLKRDPTTMSFGGGKRLCVAETFSKNTMFLFIAGLLQKFDFVLADGISEPPDPMNHVSGINTSIPNFWMQAVLRE